MSSTDYQNLEVIRIALVSPGDVAEERKLANEVVENINKHLAIPLGIFIDVKQWEDVYPALHPHGPQGQIDSQLDIPECDLVVGVFWKRLGTLTAYGQTGAEHEIQAAYDTWVTHQKPQVMLYFNRGPFSPSTVEDAKQAGMVLEFKEKFKDKGLRDEYDGPFMFAEHFRNHLSQLIAERVNARGPTIPVVPCFVSAFPRYVRGEGMTELVAEITLLFATSPGAKPTMCKVTVSLNTNLTNAIAEDNVLADVSLSVKDTSFGAITRFQGRVIGVNSAQFENVVIDLAGPIGKREYTITGLRANAFQLGVASTINETFVMAGIQIESSTEQLIHVVNPTVNVGILKSGTLFRVLPDPTFTFSRTSGVNSGFALRQAGVLPEVSFRLRFEEPYLDYFTNAAEEGRYRYLTTSIPAPSGIRFSVRFLFLPSNVRMYVTTRDVASDDPTQLSATLIRANSVGSGHSDPIQADCLTSGAISLAEIEPLDGVICATWEWVRAGTHPDFPLRRWLEFGVAIVAASNEASIGNVTVVGSFAPFSTVATSSLGSPVPRFANVRPPVPAFTIIE